MDSVIGILHPLSKELSQVAPIPEEITKLATEREEAKQQKDYAKADQLRSQIEQAGYTISDTPQGPKIAKK
jgi:cysteinyl-tRNA synthetase